MESDQAPSHLAIIVVCVIAIGLGAFYFFGLAQEQASPKAAVPDVQQPITEAIPIPQKERDTIPPAADWQDLFHLRYLTGRFEPSEHPDLVRVPNELTDQSRAHYLHRRALAAFERMHAAAARDSVQLTIISAFRGFARQRMIWEAKWEGRRLLEGNTNARTAYPDPAERARAILRYSSMPGTSRHHWGTDFDLNRLNNRYFASQEGKRVYDWLRANAATYGFCQSYTAKGADRPTGYEEEKWHWSYRPLADSLMTFAAQHLRDEDITGFAGAESAIRIGVVKNYVLGVSQTCK